VQRAKVLAETGIHSVRDLLYYVPRRYLDRSLVLPIAQLSTDREVTIIGRVSSVQTSFRPRSRLTLTVEDDSGSVECVWFAGSKYLAKNFEQGDHLALSGQVRTYKGRQQFTHPEYEFVSLSGEQSFLHTAGVVPLYSTSADLKERGLRTRNFRRIMAQALDQFAADVVDTLAPGDRVQLGLMDLTTSLRSIHFPSDAESAEQARRRLAFEELYQQQLLLASARARRRASRNGISLRKRHLVERFLEHLPFSPTEAQYRVVEEVARDMEDPCQMCRLLQGDVGSGKTLVALCAMLQAVGSGFQAALMVPTEILASQHFHTLTQQLGPLGINPLLLVGKQRASLRLELLNSIETGAADIVVGTHALIQDNVQFPHLGLVVIDEQHRFGVVQRDLLARKKEQANLLYLTATPIPRTLALALYGDTDVSILNQLPPGRKPVKTAARSEASREDILRFVAEQLDSGRQAYLVYPSIEDSKKLGLRSASRAFEELSSGILSHYRLGLLHGQMPEDEKRSTMQAFVEGRIQALVSTTVIEVGVDVANATVMVIENAERFGLAQLHQLRGRVGRGVNESYCVLINAAAADSDITAAQNRIELLCRTNDGFEIADEDLALRGPGELLGTAQAGQAAFAVADLRSDGELLRQARELASRVVERIESIAV
jgi:ATP-dependent DNA helicase RecG